MDNQSLPDKTVQLLSRVLPLIMMIIAAGALIGWQFDIVVLKSIFPDVVPMNPLAALTFLLLACSILLSQRNQTTGSIMIGRVVAIFAFLVGAIAYLRIVWGIDLQHDQILFHDQILHITKFARNRIAPNTGLNFMLTGAAMLLLSWNSRSKLAQVFLISTFMIAIIAILGYVYSVKNLYGFLSYTPMAINTAIAFSLLSLTILFSYPESGVARLAGSSGLGGITARRLIPPIVILPAILGWLALQGRVANIFDREHGFFFLIVTFTFVFLALVFHLASSLDETDRSKIAVQRELLTSRKDLEATNKLLDTKLSDADKARTAMLNILEDVEEAKVKDDVLLSSIGDGMVATDEIGNVILANHAFEEILGWKVSEVTSKKIVTIVTLLDAAGKAVPPHERPMEIVLKSGEKVSMSDKIYLRKDGTPVPVMMTVTPIKLHGKISGTIEVFRDITHEKEVDRMKTEFISLASHQLRTPLTSMKWFSEMLLDGDAGKLSEEQHEYIKNISLSNERMIELVNSLLNISRIESGRIIIDPQPTDMNELIQGVMTDLTAKIKEKKQNIIFSVNERLPKLNIDPKLIRNVYINILTNAIKYSPPESDITIFISPKDDGIISQISDNGFGIPKAQQERLFEKFFRAENISKKVTEGTGLGLYLVKAIIESSGGKIWFKSEENKGTTFWFSLPLGGSVKKEGEVSLDT